MTARGVAWRTGLRWRFRGAGRDDGYSTPFWLLCSIVFLGLLAVVVDGGGQMRASAKADDLAAEAARAAAQQIDPTQAIPGEDIAVDPEAAISAAEDYLAKAGVSGRATVTDDGTEVEVAVTDTYDCTMLGAFGAPTLRVSGAGKASLLYQVGD